MNQNANEYPNEARLVRIIQEKIGPVFTRREIEHLRLGDRDSLDRLVRSGFVRPVRRGLYEVAEEPRVRIAHEFALALAMVPPGDGAYISWRSALAHYNLTEQMSRIVYVAVPRPRRAVRLGGARIQFVVQERARRYDIREISLSGAKIPIVSPEKAVIDALDRPAYAGGLREVVRALSSKAYLDYARLVQLARRYPSGTLVRRLGYLMTVLHLGDASPLRARVRLVDKPVRLDLDEKATLRMDRDWRVIDNVGEAEIRGWVTL